MKNKAYRSLGGLLTSAPRAHFGYGPFREIPLNPEDQLVFSGEILSKQVRFAFPMHVKKTFEVLEKGDLDKIQELVRPRLGKELEKHFFNKEKNVSFQLINKNEPQSYTLDCVRGITKLFGFNLANFDPELIKKRKPKGIFEGFKIKRIWFKPKGLIPRQAWFDSVTICDVLINTNSKFRIVDKAKKGMPELLKQRDSGLSLYTVQFICSSQYERLPPPGLLGENEDSLNEAIKVDERRNLKLQFFSLKKQRDYEANGWRMNNINGWIESKGILEDLV